MTKDLISPISLFSIFWVVLLLQLVQRLVAWLLSRCKGTWVGAAADVEEDEAAVEERRLRETIAALAKQAAPLNTPSTFAKHAKIQRRINKLRRELDALRAARADAKPVPIAPKQSLVALVFSYLVPMLPSAVVYGYVAYIWWEVPLLQVHFLESLALACGLPAVSFEVGILVWLFACHQVTRRVLP